QDGRIKPTVMAPGVDVVSASDDACGTMTLSGTSMAAPVVAGAAALVRQYFTDGYYPTGNRRAQDSLTPSAALLKAVLIAGAQPMRGANTDGPIPSTGQGFGRVDLSQALAFADDDHHLWVRDENDGLEPGGYISFELRLAAPGPLKIALTWMDVPGAPGAERALVNDLDLEVEGPSGRYHGNALANGASTPGGNSDTVNVEEIVSLPRATAGKYTVTVRGTNVPLGPQPFALAVVSPSVTVRELGGSPGQASGSAGTLGADGTASGDHAGGCQAAGGSDTVSLCIAVATLLARRRRRTEGRA
ncbi:MAG TPA: S8 family serine peptidase, partial [Myxococcota bacterium]|nr:S8 family serine peptidase [Myxococcota bacterium]